MHNWSKSVVSVVCENIISKKIKNKKKNETRLTAKKMTKMPAVRACSLIGFPSKLLMQQSLMVLCVFFCHGYQNTGAAYIT